MKKNTYVFKLGNVSGAMASRYVYELREALLDATSTIEVDLRRSDPQAQDWGHDLIVGIFSSTGISSIVAAVVSFLNRRREAMLIIKRDGDQEQIELKYVRDDIAFRALEGYFNDKQGKNKIE